MPDFLFEWSILWEIHRDLLRVFSSQFYWKWTVQIVQIRLHYSSHCTSTIRKFAKDCSPNRLRLSAFSCLFALPSLPILGCHCVIRFRRINTPARRFSKILKNRILIVFRVLLNLVRYIQSIGCYSRSSYPWHEIMRIRELHINYDLLPVYFVENRKLSKARSTYECILKWQFHDIFTFLNRIYNLYHWNRSWLCMDMQWSFWLHVGKNVLHKKLFTDFCTKTQHGINICDVMKTLDRHLDRLAYCPALCIVTELWFFCDVQDIFIDIAIGPSSAVCFLLFMDFN